MLRNDLKRAILSKSMMASVSLGVIAIAVGILSMPVAAAVRLYFGEAADITDIQRWELIYNCFNKVTLWNFGNYYFFLVIPLICCIPFSVAYLKDRETGYNKYQIIRGSYREYLCSKFLATFISGFLVIMVVMLIYLLSINILDSGDKYRSIYSSGTLLGELENRHFNIFVLVHGLVVSCVGGVYAVMGLACTKITRNILTGLAFPFLFYNLMDYAMSILKLYKFSPSAITLFYRIDSDIVAIRPADIFCQLFVLLALGATFFFITYWRNSNEYV